MSAELWTAVTIHLLGIAFASGVVYAKVSSIDKRLERIENAMDSGVLHVRAAAKAAGAQL